MDQRQRDLWKTLMSFNREQRRKELTHLDDYIADSWIEKDKQWLP